jgi:hypothetical protein
MKDQNMIRGWFEAIQALQICDTYYLFAEYGTLWGVKVWILGYGEWETHYLLTQRDFQYFMENTAKGK